jgi:hypothetical protein
VEVFAASATFISTFGRLRIKLAHLGAAGLRILDFLNPSRAVIAVSVSVATFGSVHAQKFSDREVLQRCPSVYAQIHANKIVAMKAFGAASPDSALG